jgi:hypothetical protein
MYSSEYVPKSFKMHIFIPKAYTVNAMSANPGMVNARKILLGGI